LAGQARAANVIFLARPRTRTAGQLLPFMTDSNGVVHWAGKTLQLCRPTPAASAAVGWHCDTWANSAAPRRVVQLWL
jgi:hypothetical protein